MPAPALPSPVAELVAAVNRGDIETFLAFFAEDGAVDDWGRRFVGRTAIRNWSDKEFIGAHGRMSVSKVEQHGNEIAVDAAWKSSYYSGNSRFIFIVAGGQIREMRIADE